MARKTTTEQFAPKAFWLSALWSWLAGGAQVPEINREHEYVHYEHSDINVRGVMVTAVAVLLGTWLIGVLLIFLFHHFKKVHNANETQAAAARTHQVLLPPEPRLQESPQRDLHELNEAAKAELQRYHWVDRQNGVVAIPIERAMELTAQRGIPPQKPSANNYFAPRAGSPLTGFAENTGETPR